MTKNIIALACVAVALMGLEVRADLVGYWSLDGNETDFSGYGNNGNPLAGGSYVLDTPLASGQSVSFNDVSGQRIEIPDAPSLDLASGLTLSAWVNVNNLSDFQMILAKNPSGTAAANLAGNFEFRINAGSGTLGLLHQTSAGSTQIGYTSPNAVTAGNWHHVAAALESGGGVRLYIDGKNAGSFATGTFDGTILNNNPVLIGDRADNTHHFDGKVDDVAIYNAALPPEQIAALAGQSRTPLSAVTTEISGINSGAPSWLGGRTPNRVTDGSGITPDNDGDLTPQHDVNPGNMWLTAQNPAASDRWIKFNLNGLHKLDAAQIWNYNETGTTERQVTSALVQTSTDGINWTTLGGGPQSLAPTATGAAGYDNTNTLPMQGVEARFVRFGNPATPLVQQGTTLGNYLGFSEVKFYGDTIATSDVQFTATAAASSELGGFDR
ncbi:MAG: LamG-like jellyroll fold domain-containing protein, partial [Pirellulales bacterium]